MSRFKPVNRHVFKASATSFAMMALYGLFLNMIGELIPPIIEDFGISLTKAGLIQAFFNLGGIVTLVGMIYLSDLVRKSRQVFYSFLFFSITLALTGLLASSYVLIVAAFVLFGFSTKIFDVSVNAYINEINTTGREFYLQMLHMFFGIGAVLGPVSASLLSKTAMGWKSVFLFLGIACIVMSIVSFATIFKTSPMTESMPDRHAEDKLNLASLFKNPQVWVLTISAMCFSGSYVGLVTWFPSYAKSLETDAGKLSGIILSIYFIGFVISRIVSSLILKESNSRKLIILTALGGTATLFAAILIGRTWAFFAFLFLSGLFTGATLPIIIFVACLNFPRNTGGITSIMYTGIAVTAILVPYVMGVIGDSSSIARAMPLTGYVMAASFVSALLIRRREA
jgi:fucose permease